MSARPVVARRVGFYAGTFDTVKTGNLDLI